MNKEEAAAILRLENKVQELTVLVSSLIDHFHVGKKPPDLDDIERQAARMAERHFRRMEKKMLSNKVVVASIVLSKMYHSPIVLSGHYPVGIEDVGVKTWR